MQSLAPADLIPACDSVTMEDYVRGSYQSVTVQLVSARLTQEISSGGKLAQQDGV